MLSWLSAYLRTVFRERTWDQEFVEILSKENIKKTVCCSDEEFNSSDMEMFKQEFQHLSLQEYLESFEELDVQLKGLKEGIIDKYRAAWQTVVFDRQDNNNVYLCTVTVFSLHCNYSVTSWTKAFNHANMIQMLHYSLDEGGLNSLSILNL